MFRKLSSILTGGLALLLVASAGTLAADETMAGTVQKVDPQSGRFTLRSEAGKAMELQAPAALLEDLETGDIVLVRLSGQKVTEIQKQEGVQRPPGMGSAPPPGTGGAPPPPRQEAPPMGRPPRQ
jgi:hypothetical protein